MNRLLQNILLTVCLSLFTTVGFAKTTKVVIGGGPYLDIPQLSVAMDSNLWSENHLEAEVIPFRSGRAAFEALLGGQLDLAFMAEFPAVIGAMRKQNFRVISECRNIRPLELYMAVMIPSTPLLNWLGSQLA